MKTKKMFAQVPSVLPHHHSQLHHLHTPYRTCKMIFTASNMQFWTTSPAQHLGQYNLPVINM